MLLSELYGWHYVISWDNRVPANSTAMLKALAKLGNVSRIHTKTSVALSPRIGKTWRHIRRAIEENLHPIKGNAFYVNVRTQKAFQIGKRTKWNWKKFP
jgi:hypothetical protein